MVKERTVEIAPKPDQIQFYQPQRVSLPTHVIPNKKNIVVLDQGTEGVSVGVSLAGLINYLTARRDGVRFDASIRMLQALAERYDGFDHSAGLDIGSYIWAGLYGWKKHGVTTQEIWPYYPGKRDNDFTEERQRLAAPFKLESYERVPKNVQVVKAAIVERGAVLAGITTNRSWFKPKEGIIPYSPRQSILGGHAVVLLGYTPDGFIIENSWGENWGNLVLDGQTYPGLAILTYQDFEANFNDAYVVRLWPQETSPRKPFIVRAGYIPDSPKGDHDYLNIMPDVRAISAVLAARDVKPPLALGLFGNWGTGKSFFMERLKKEIGRLSAIEETKPGSTPYCQPIIQIEFNAWHFLDTNLWASLVSEVFDHLHERIRPPEAPLEETRRRLIEKLGDAAGLYRQSELELKEAQQDLHIAETCLTISKMAQATNAKKFASTSDEINSQVQQLLKFRVRLRNLWIRLFKEKDKEILHQRWRSLVLSLGVAIGVGLIPSLLAAAYPETFRQLSDWVNASWTWVVGALTWLGVQWQGVSRFLGDLKEKMIMASQLNEKQKTSIADDLSKNKDEKGNIDFKASVKEAEDKKEKAKQRLEQVQRELAALSPRWQMQQYLVDRSTSQDYRSQLGLISLIRRDFEKLSSLLESCEKESSSTECKDQPEEEPLKLPFERIILYIDDLDRCTPKRVVEVLEAVHLLLAFPLFIVVVAVDPRWLRTCLEMTYPTLSMQSSEGEEALDLPATPQDYLEKIFQIPFYLRPIDRYGYGNMIRGLVDPEVAPDSKPKVMSEGGIEKTSIDSGKDNTVDRSQQISGPRPNESEVKNGGTPIKLEEGKPEEETAEDSKLVNPDLLRFKSWEMDDLQLLSPMFRTPRAVKRFINTYRLVKVGVDAADIDRFEGSRDAPGTSRIAQVLLAVVAGYPNQAPRFLQRLLAEMYAEKPATSWKEFLLTCKNQPISAQTQTHPIKQQSSSQRSRITTTLNKAKPGESNEKEWLKMCDALLSISKDGFLQEDLGPYIEMVKNVARFSFSVSDLPTLRENR